MCAPCQAAAQLRAQKLKPVGISTANNVIVREENTIDHCGITYDFLRELDVKLLSKYNESKDRQWLAYSSEILNFKAIYIYTSMCDNVGRINEINNIANA
jgi:hypothetical protein